MIWFLIKILLTNNNKLFSVKTNLRYYCNNFITYSLANLNKYKSLSMTNVQYFLFNIYILSWINSVIVQFSYPLNIERIHKYETFMRPTLLLLSRSDVTRNIIFVRSGQYLWQTRRVQRTGFIPVTLYYGSYLKSDMR